VMAAHAAPIPFFNTAFDTNAVALAGSVVDLQSAATPANTLPLSSNAVAVGTTDLATADAFADNGFLSASSNVFGSTSVVDGVATSHFLGSFNNGVATLLSFNLDTTSSSSGTGTADGYLAILLTSGGQTLINQVLTSSGTFNFTFARPIGTTSLLDVTLVSESSAFAGTGDGFNLGIGTFFAAVPLPPTWPLLLVAFGACGAVQRRRGAGRL
jgi:hypothetical protein